MNGFAQALFWGWFLAGELENPRAGSGTKLSLPLDIALMSWPGLPNFYAWATRHVINFGCCKKDFPGLPQLAIPFQGRLSQKVGEEASMLGVGLPECFGQPLAVATAAYASRHRDGSPAENVRFKSQSKTWCSGHMWSYVVMVLPCILENLGMCFFFAFSPWAPSIVCTGSGNVGGTVVPRVLDVKVLGVEDVKGSKGSWRVAIQWGLAVGDTTLCWYRINCIYIIITFLWALLSTASWKPRQKEQMDNSALDSFAASVGFPGRAKTCISDSIRTAGQHLKF